MPGTIDRLAYSLLTLCSDSALRIKVLNKLKKSNNKFLRAIIAQAIGDSEPTVRLAALEAINFDDVNCFALIPKLAELILADTADPRVFMIAKSRNVQRLAIERIPALDGFPIETQQILALACKQGDDPAFQISVNTLLDRSANEFVASSLESALSRDNEFVAEQIFKRATDATQGVNLLINSGVIPANPTSSRMRDLNVAVLNRTLEIDAHSYYSFMKHLEHEQLSLLFKPLVVLVSENDGAAELAERVDQVIGFMKVSNDESSGRISFARYLADSHAAVRLRAAAEIIRHSLKTGQTAQLCLPDTLKSIRSALTDTGSREIAYAGIISAGMISSAVIHADPIEAAQFVDDIVKALSGHFPNSHDDDYSEKVAICAGESLQYLVNDTPEAFDRLVVHVRNECIPSVRLAASTLLRSHTELDQRIFIELSNDKNFTVREVSASNLDGSSTESRMRLLELLNDSNESICIAAAQSLRRHKITIPGCVDIMLHQFADRSEAVQNTFLSTLKELDLDQSTLRAVSRHEFDDVRAMAISQLDVTCQESLNRIIELLNDSNDQICIDAAKLFDQHNIKVPIAVDVMLHDLADRSKIVQNTFIKAIKEMLWDQDTMIAISKDSFDDVRLMTVSQLDCSYDNSRKRLLEFLDESNEKICIAAAEKIFEYGHAASLEIAVSKIKSLPVHTQVKVIIALERHGGGETTCRQILQALLEKPDEQCCSYIGCILAQGHCSLGIPILLECACAGFDDHNREASKGLEELASHVGNEVPELFFISGQKNPFVRALGLLVLREHLPNPRVMNCIRKGLDDPDLLVRATAKDLLSETMTELELLYFLSVCAFGPGSYVFHLSFSSGSAMARLVSSWEDAAEKIVGMSQKFLFMEPINLSKAEENRFTPEARDGANAMMNELKQKFNAARSEAENRSKELLFSHLEELIHKNPQVAFPLAKGLMYFDEAYHKKPGKVSFKAVSVTRTPDENEEIFRQQTFNSCGRELLKYLWNKFTGVSLTQLEEKAALCSSERDVCENSVGNDCKSETRLLAERFYQQAREHMVVGGLMDRSLELLNRAIEVDPTFADAFDARYTVHTSLGNADKALADMHECARLVQNLGETTRDNSIRWS